MRADSQLTASAPLGYPDRMPSARDDVAGALVAEASNAQELADVLGRILGVLRDAWRADRAVAVREDEQGRTAVVAAVPEQPFDPDVLARALRANDAVTIAAGGGLANVLALGLRPAGNGRWGVGLARARSPWTAAERRGLRELRPHLELLLERARLRTEVARAGEREKMAAAEHERFLNVISHELRNPLAPILMWTSTLRRLRPADADVQRATQAIAHAVNLERRLIEELLDLSRLERGTLETYRETFDLREVVRGVVDERTASATEAELTLECNVPAKPVRVHVDRARLSQVLHALVENAIKFVSAGGSVRVELARNAMRAEIAVVDSGPGIPADVLAQRFTPFVKGRNARGGLGLGLALARRLLELYGGTIDAVSPPDGGARVVVTLPLA